MRPQQWECADCATFVAKRNASDHQGQRGQTGPARTHEDSRRFGIPLMVEPSSDTTCTRPSQPAKSETRARRGFTEKLLERTRSRAWTRFRESDISDAGRTVVRCPARSGGLPRKAQTAKALSRGRINQGPAPPESAACACSAITRTRSAHAVPETAARAAARKFAAASSLRLSLASVSPRMS